MRRGAASAPLLGPRSALHAHARGHGSCRVRTYKRACVFRILLLPPLASVGANCASREKCANVRTYVGTSVRNGRAVLTSNAKCANNARCDTCAKCAKCNHCESRAIRARCANCACCACYACCRWQVCQPPKRARTYIRTYDNRANRANRAVLHACFFACAHPYVRTYAHTWEPEYARTHDTWEPEHVRTYHRGGN